MGVLRVDQRGLTQVEYLILVALVLVGLIIGWRLMGNAVAEESEEAAEALGVGAEVEAGAVVVAPQPPSVQSARQLRVEGASAPSPGAPPAATAPRPAPAGPDPAGSPDAILRAITAFSRGQTSGRQLVETLGGLEATSGVLQAGDLGTEAMSTLLRAFYGESLRQHEEHLSRSRRIDEAADAIAAEARGRGDDPGWVGDAIAVLAGRMRLSTTERTRVAERIATAIGERNPVAAQRILGGELERRLGEASVDGRSSIAQVFLAVDLAATQLEAGRGPLAADVLASAARRARDTAAASTDPADRSFWNSVAAMLDAQAAGYRATTPNATYDAVRALSTAASEATRLQESLNASGARVPAAVLEALAGQSRVEASLLAEAAANTNVLIGRGVLQTYRAIVMASFDQKIANVGGLSERIWGTATELRAQKARMAVVFDELDRIMQQHGVGMGRAWNIMFDDNRMIFARDGSPLYGQRFVSRNDAATFLRDHEITRGVLIPMADLSDALAAGNPEAIDAARARAVEVLRERGQWEVSRAVLDGLQRDARSAAGAERARQLDASESGEWWRAKAGEFVERELPILVLSGLASGGVGWGARAGTLALGWGTRTARGVQIVVELGVFVPTNNVLSDVITGRRADWSAGGLTRDYAITVAGYGLFRLAGAGWRYVRGRMVRTDPGLGRYLDDLAPPGTVNLGDDAFRPGRQVSVRRTSGALEGNWQILRVEADGAILVEQLGTRATKTIARDVLVELNPQLIPRGTQVRVPRSNGAIDDGWTVAEHLPNGRIRVTKPGVGYKDVSVRDLLTHNEGMFRPGGIGGPAIGPAVRVNGEARVQSEAFARTNRVPEGQPIRDGYADGGRGMRVEADGSVTGAGREVLVVDRARDAALQRHLEWARGLRTMPAEERARRIAQYVDEQLSRGGNDMAVHNQLVAQARGREVLLGDVVTCGGGVCRHRALLYKVLADEAGLQTALVRGNYRAGDFSGGHAWNEVVLPNGSRILVDPYRRGAGYHMRPPHELRDVYRGVGDEAIYNAPSTTIAPPPVRPAGEHTQVINPALGQGQVLIDNNIAIAMRNQVAGTANAAELRSVAVLNGQGTPRVSAATAAEYASGGRGTFPGASVPTTVPATDPRFVRVLDALNQPGRVVGGTSGATDRQIVAEAFFAETAPGVRTTLITADRGVYNNLARIAGIDPARVNLFTAHPTGFEVTIWDGSVTRRIWVVAVPPG